MNERVTIERVFQDMRDFGKLVTKKELRQAIFDFGREIALVDQAISFSFYRQANANYLLVEFKGPGVSDSESQHIDYLWTQLRNGLPSSIAGKFPTPLVRSSFSVRNLRDIPNTITATLWRGSTKAA